MTNELEKQFFNTFNIEPIGCNDNKNCTGALDCTQCPNAKYPEITDRILLELIVIISSKIPFLGRAMYMEHRYRNIEDLKVTVLNMLIEYKVQYEHQVRTLFEEGYNNDR